MRVGERPREPVQGSQSSGCHRQTSGQLARGLGRPDGRREGRGGGHREPSRNSGSDVSHWACLIWTPAPKGHPSTSPSRGEVLTHDLRVSSAGGALGSPPQKETSCTPLRPPAPTIPGAASVPPGHPPSRLPQPPPAQCVPPAQSSPVNLQGLPSSDWMKPESRTGSQGVYNLGSSLLPAHQPCPHIKVAQSCPTL